MGVYLDVHADEGGTYIVNISTYDETGAAKAPKTLFWTLTDKTGKIIINNRKNVEIPNPTESENVVIKGDDLAILSSEEDLPEVIRVFTVTGTYDSNMGLNLPLRGRCYITVDNYEALPLT